MLIVNTWPNVGMLLSHTSKAVDFKIRKKATNIV